MKKHLLFATLLAVATILTACNGQPNDRLKIDGKKYVISLGAVDYDEQAGTVTIEVLADGQPLPNTTEYSRSSVNIGGEEVSSSVSARQPVKMSLQVQGRLPGYDALLSSSDDGVFTFAVTDSPEGISVYTGNGTVGETVYFNGATKEVISPDEYYLPVMRQQ